MKELANNPDGGGWRSVGRTGRPEPVGHDHSRVAYALAIKPKRTRAYRPQTNGKIETLPPHDGRAGPSAACIS